MKEAIINLLKIKSLITLMVVGACLALSLYIVMYKGAGIPEQLWSLLTMVIGFYFGTQTKKE